MRTLLAILFLVLTACKPAAPEPVEPVWGKQPCAHCMMLLSDRAAAAQAQLHDGSHVYFDDVGCLLEWMNTQEATVSKSWVHAPDGKSWLDARTVHYSQHNVTPMDYGLLPAESGLPYQAARAFVRQQAQQRRESMR